MAKKDEVIILTPEEIKQLDTDITDVLVKQNVTEKLFADLAAEYDGITIKGQEDKEGYNRVSAARKAYKETRILIRKICEKGREKSNAQSQKWIAKQKELTARVEPREEELEKMEKEYETERDRLKEEKRQKEENRRMERASGLMGFGAKFEAGKWLLGGLDYDDTIIREADDDVYGGIRDEYKAIFDENERIRKEKEAAEEKERQEMAKMRKERRGARVDILKMLGMKVEPDGQYMEGVGMHFNDTHMGMLLDGDSDYWAEQVDKIKGRIATFKKEEEERVEQERVEKEAREKSHARERRLQEAGMVSYRDGTMKGNESVIAYDVLNAMPDEEFDTLVEKYAAKKKDIEDAQAKEREEQRQKELKEAQDKARGEERNSELSRLGYSWTGGYLELGQLPQEEWDRKISEVREQRRKVEEEQQRQKDKEEEDKKRIQKEQELAEATDKEKWQEVVKYLKSTPFPEMKSGPYRKKLNSVKDFIADL